MAETGIAKRVDEKNVRVSEETRAGERYIKPAVDIIEMDDGLTLIADIPGAAKESIDVTAERETLTISAPVSRTMPGRHIYSEFEYAHYYRQFSIPAALDYGKVKAEFVNGLLTLKVPVSEAVKPHKIKIKA